MAPFSLAGRYNRRVPFAETAVRLVSLIVKLLVFLLLLGFAALNSEFVTLRYFLDLNLQVPLSLIILIAFGAGLLAGFLACTPQLLRNRRELKGLRSLRRTTTRG